MAWFLCNIGGAGGLTLTVTCDSSFAGLTITCTDGDTTLTKTCPSQSPYAVEFLLPNGGTWVISGVVSGVTQSTTVIVPDSTELHVIPNGSSVTPVNDIQIWLHCGNIWNKNYSTIDQVLADLTTLLALISSNNAADYMARSTTWASIITANSPAMTYIGANDYCSNKLLANSTWLNAICNSTYFESVLNVKVPTMTSNTAPSGEVLYSAELYYPAWKAFNGTNSGETDGWATTLVAGTSYIGYQFTKPVKIYKASITNRNFGSDANCRIHTFKVQSYSNNNWTDVTGEIDRGSAANAANYNTIHNFANTKPSSNKIRIVVSSDFSPYNITGVGMLQFYGRES